MINISDSYELWVIAQSRVCEVIVGILCGGLMMMILPSTSDGSNLLTALKTMHARLLEHASLLWVPETTDAIRTAHESVIGQILTMNLLRIRAFWSHYRFRRQNPLLNYLLHQQLRMTSVISSLRRMLLNWPDAPANTRRYWSRCSPSSPPSCRQLSRCADPGAAGAASGCRLPAHRFLGAIALFLSHLRRAAAGSAALKMPRRSPSSMCPPPAVSPPYRSGGGVAQRCPYLCALVAIGAWGSVPSGPAARRP
nr:Fusaric acid resistance protein family [Klebsiella pneumoniae]